MSQYDEYLKYDQKRFFKTIKGLVSKGGKFIEEALDLVKAMKESMDLENVNLSDILKKMDSDVQKLLKKAQESESFEDVCKLSELEQEKDKLTKQITDSVIFYSTICAELDSILRMSSSQHTVHGASAIARGDPTIASLTVEVAKLLTQMVEFWATYDDRREDHKKSTETRDIQGRQLSLQISDVRGDGACGWRAFITGAIRLVCGKQLSYDPSRMSEFIYEVKLLVIELVQILAQNPLNGDFIGDMMTVPENGGKKNLETYSRMVLAPDYQATNFELRLLCVLFGLVNPQLSQVNVIHSNPIFGEIYQSISVSGRVLPVSNEQINIWYVSGHYKSVKLPDKEVLPPIISPDDAIYY